MPVHHSGSWGQSLDRHLSGVSLGRRGNNTAFRCLLLAIGDLEIFVKANNCRNGGHGGGFGDGIEPHPDCRGTESARTGAGAIPLTFLIRYYGEGIASYSML